MKIMSFNHNLIVYHTTLTSRGIYPNFHSEKVIVYDDWIYTNFEFLSFSGYIVFEYENKKFRLTSDRIEVMSGNQNAIINNEWCYSSPFLKFEKGYVSDIKCLDNKMFIHMPDHLVSSYLKWKLQS